MVGREPKVLPLDMAMQYVREKNLKNIQNELDALKEKYSGKELRMLRKAIIVTRFEEQNLLNDFIDKYWSNGKTNEGKKRIRGYKRNINILEKSGKTYTSELKESSFVYEEDLRDFLANNLTHIEPDLKLYEADGINGIEYSVDINHKRIDILAIDKNNLPVVIELKVKQGHEKVIGQCQYYKNRIMDIFDVDKVRVIIIARKMSEQLKIATRDMSDYTLLEYSLKVEIKDAK